MIASNSTPRGGLFHDGLVDRTSNGWKSFRTATAGLIVVAGLSLSACATGGAGEVGYVAPPSASNAPPARERAPASPANLALQDSNSKIVGVWEGETQADCNTSEANRCNARQEITITMIDTDSGLRGFYRCGYGTMNCYDMNETGKIVRATLNGSQMTARVQMPDGTSCIYTGRTVGGNGVNGGYSCYGGGALIESGSWKGRRSY